MFVFKKEQKAFDFGGVTIGGQPGENPTVLVGGLFFAGQPIVEDTKKGLFDKAVAKEWIETGVSMSKETGHPLVIQVFGRSATAMERHLHWLVENFDGPFIFESTSAKTRKSAIQYCDESGLGDRAIYNSVNMSLKDDEKEVLKASSLNNAIVLGWTPKSVALSERMDTIYTRHEVDLNKWVNVYLDCIESRIDCKNLIVTPVKDAIEYHSGCLSGVNK